MMNVALFRKNFDWIFFALCGFSLFLSYSIVRAPDVKPTFKVSLFAQPMDVNDLDQKRISPRPYLFYVDTVNFKGKKQLQHVRRGKMPFEKNYFLEIDGKFLLAFETGLKFFVKSDDGFRLFVDGEILMEHKFSRNVAENVKVKKLAAGLHHVKIIYFQKNGPMALQARLEAEDGANGTVWGEALPFLKWLEQTP